MQQQQYGSYGYYNYPPYSTPYMGSNPTTSGYPPFYGPPQSQQPPPAPHTNNPPAPAPYSFDAAAYNLKPNASTSGPSRAHRRTSTVPASAAAPLKSAMKKTVNAFTQAEATIGRQLTNPFHNPAASNPYPTQPPGMQMPRPRVHSNPAHPQNMRDDPNDWDIQQPVAYHMLVSFHGYNELRIEHVMKKALDDLRSDIWPIWQEGIESEIVEANNCIVKFRNNPWDMGGPNIRIAYKLIIDFFRLFQEKGYSFQTSVNISTPTPRLIFQVTQPDPRACFFMAYFNHDGTRFTLIDAPTQTDLSFVSRLRETFSFTGRAIHIKPAEDNIRVVEVKKRPNTNTPEVEPSVLFVEILKTLNLLGFQLDASLSFARKGTLGLRSPRELLVFKGQIPG